jgi:hypothetical protein
MAMRVQTAVFWVVTPRIFQVNINDLEVHAPFQPSRWNQHVPLKR